MPMDAVPRSAPNPRTDPEVVRLLYGMRLAQGLGRSVNLHVT